MDDAEVREQELHDRRMRRRAATLSKVIEMRNAINDIELALRVDDDLEEIVARFDGCRENVVVRPKITLGELRQITRALAECCRIINSPEYEPAKLSG